MLSQPLAYIHRIIKNQFGININKLMRRKAQVPMSEKLKNMHWPVTFFYAFRWNESTLSTSYGNAFNIFILKDIYIKGIVYIWLIDIDSGHVVNTWYSSSLSPKQTPVINAAYTGVHEHSPSAVNSPRVIWKTLPKACKTRTIPTNTSSVLEPAMSDIYWGRCPQFLLLCRRQRRC